MPTPDSGLKFTLQSFLSQLKALGTSGVLDFYNKLRLSEGVKDAEYTIDTEDIKRVIRELNANVSDLDVKLIFGFLDYERSTKVSLKKFMDVLCIPFTIKRISLIDLGWKKISPSGSDSVFFSSMLRLYDVSATDDVRKGKLTPQQALSNFANSFDGSNTPTGKINKQEFADYYRYYGTTLNEEKFEKIFRNSWHINDILPELEPDMRSIDFEEKAKKIKERVSSKRLAPQMPTAMSKLMDSETILAEPIQLPNAVLNNDVNSMYKRTNIIGGIDCKDAFVTTTQQAADGKPHDDGPRKNNLKRVSMSVETKLDRTVSTITGEQMWSDEAWVEEHKAKLALAAKKNAQQEEDDREADLKSDPRLLKLKTALKARGATGIIGLSKKFKILDDDGSGTLNLTEFTKCIRESQLPLSVEETAQLFGLFDVDKSGTISYDEFISVVRGPMNRRRSALVSLAFDIMDTDGSREISLNDVLGVYDASRHPDVISGKRTPKEILEEFLSTFESGGTRDGTVSKEEFINYYTNISAGINSDNYFELMIRNAWHISGGEGECANTSNQRVLVTLADGTQVVQELQNDLRGDRKDKAGLVARLRTQGVNAAAVSTFDGMEDSNGGKQRSRGGAGGGAGGGGENNTGHRLFGDGNGPSAAAQARALLNKPTSESESNISKLRNELRARGATGIAGLARKFKTIDDDGTGCLNFEEFAKCLKECKLPFNANEIRQLFLAFDKDKSGTISHDEFLYAIRGPMNDRRSALVTLAFTILDKDGSGEVTLNDIADVYDSSKHPEVVSGRRTAKDILNEFLGNFEVGGVADGIVTKEEFINYYTNLSASIESDNYFELMIRNAWHISGGEGECANTSNQRVLVTLADGTQVVQELQNDLRGDRKDKAGLVARLRAQGVNAAAVSTFDGMEDSNGGKQSKQRPFTGQRANATAAGSNQGASMRRMIDKKNAARREDPLVVKLRLELKRRGLVGIIDLATRFIAIDRKASGMIDFEQFLRCIKDCQLPILNDEAKQLYLLFHEGVDALNYEQFLTTIKGEPMKSSRLDLVNLAFDKLDSARSGQLHFNTAIGLYDSSSHPDVLSGKRSPKEILDEFLNTFQSCKSVDAFITKESFINYYDNVSFVVDNDGTFELLIRNAWDLGTGSQGKSKAFEGISRHNTLNDSARPSTSSQSRNSRVSDDKAFKLKEAVTSNILRTQPQPPSVARAQIPTTTGTKRPSSASLYGRHAVGSGGSGSRGLDQKSSTTCSDLSVLEPNMKEQIKSFKLKAVVLYGQRRFSEAEFAFTQTLSLLESALGQGHPECLKLQRDIDACRTSANKA